MALVAREELCICAFYDRTLHAREVSMSILPSCVELQYTESMARSTSQNFVDAS
jgi:hypothetical protein